MTQFTSWELIEWIKVNIKDPIDMDDKSRMHELLDVLSSDETSVAFKDFALKGLGMMAVKYSAEFIIICGALPSIKSQLLSNNPILISQCIRTLTLIANNGGEKDIMDEKVHMMVRSIVSDKNTPKHIKDQGLKLYFRILDTPLEFGF
jgi:hypothetical protein